MLYDRHCISKEANDIRIYDRRFHSGYSSVITMCIGTYETNLSGIMLLM